MSRWCSTSPWLLKHVCESVSARHLRRYINKNPLSSNITSNAPSALCLINASSFLRYSNITHLSSLSVWFLWIFYSFHLSFYNSPPLRPHPFHSTVLNRLFFLVLHMLFLLSTWLSLSLSLFKNKSLLFSREPAGGEWIWFQWESLHLDADSRWTALQPEVLCD